jgi:hypothetical protein
MNTLLLLLACAKPATSTKPPEDPGPPVVPAVVAPGYTTAPGRLIGMTKFTNGRSVEVPQFTMNRIQDLMDPGNRALVRNKLRIKAVSESDL